MFEKDEVVCLKFAHNIPLFLYIDSPKSPPPNTLLFYLPPPHSPPMQHLCYILSTYLHCTLMFADCCIYPKLTYYKTVYPPCDN